MWPRLLEHPVACFQQMLEIFCPSENQVEWNGLDDNTGGRQSGEIPCFSVCMKEWKILL